jgi:hypothetical protein
MRRDLPSDPFKMHQHTGSTSAYAHQLYQFLCFFLSSLKEDSPYRPPLSAEQRESLKSVNIALRTNPPDSEGVQSAVHKALWNLATGDFNTEDNESFENPAEHFLIFACMNESGEFKIPSFITPILARCQWFLKVIWLMQSKKDGGNNLFQYALPFCFLC